MTRVTHTAFVLFTVLTIVGSEMRPAVLAQSTKPTPCELPQAAVLIADGSAILQRWEIPDHPVWFSDALPQSPGYAAYRATIRAMDSDDPRPAVDVTAAQRAADRELWRREEANVALMYAGAGEVRSVRCL